MKIENEKLKTILNEFYRKNYNTFYPESFKIIIKHILYSPILSKYLFNDPSLCISKNFSNINLERFWTDILVYNMNKKTAKELLKNLKLINQSNFNLNILITKNEYPYIIPNTNYKYFIIWNIDKNNQIDYNKIKNCFDLENKDWIIWKNNKLYKSIKYIEHYHIIIRDSLPKFKISKLLILQRHGPREPILIPPKFIRTYWDNDYKDYFSAVMNANLTPLGKMYCKFIGEQLYNNYFEDFNFNLLDKNDIIIGSSNFNRTIETTVLTLEGLSLMNRNLDLNLFKFLSSSNILSDEEEKEYDNMMKKSIVNFGIDLTNFNKYIFELTGLKINNFRDYFELASTMKCYEFHDYQMLSSIEDNELLLDIRQTIYNLSTYYYNEINNFKNDNFNCNKYLGKTVVDNILNLFINYENKFTLLTTHDNLLMPTVKYLIYGILNNFIQFEGMEYDKSFYTKNILSKLKYLNFPNFNSSIRLELWTDDNTDYQIIRIYYCSLLLFEFNTKK